MFEIQFDKQDPNYSSFIWRLSDDLIESSIDKNKSHHHDFKRWLSNRWQSTYIVSMNQVTFDFQTEEDKAEFILRYVT